MNDAITISAPVWEGERAPLIKALLEAQRAAEAVLKEATNPHFQSKYADLAHVIDAVVPALNAAGVVVIQSPSFDGTMVSVTTILAHEGGSTLTDTLPMRPTKADPQGVGSAITYARRYALLALTGAAPEDDDGNAASVKNNTTHAPSAPSAPDSDKVKACKAAIDALAHGSHAAWWTKNAPGLTDDREKKAVYEYLSAHKARSRPMQEAA